MPLDASAMLKLGDFHMMAIKMAEEQQNSDLGCEYYGKSALNRDPEGMIAYAMILYLQLVPEEQRSKGKSNDDFLLVIPSNLHDHMNYVHMWNLLEQTASVGYICPFMIVRVDKVYQNTLVILCLCLLLQYAAHIYFDCVCFYSIQIHYFDYPRLFSNYIVVIVVSIVCCNTNVAIISTALITPVTATTN